MIHKFQHILVTGGAGFIGSELVRQLSSQGARVTVVDSLVNGSRANLEEVLGHQTGLIIADIRDHRTLEKLLPGVDIVFHLACLGVRHSVHSPAENHEVNATATLDLLIAARSAGVARFVYVSSSEVYGSARSAPMDEDHPTFPMTVYGAAKLAGESYARAFHRTYGYPTIVIRPFNTYGPRCHHEGDCGEVIPKFLLRSMAGRPMIVFGDGNQTRDFTYVSDTARGIMLIGSADEAEGETINLGSGHEISINELAREVAGTLGNDRAHVVHDAPRPGDVQRLCADTRRARQLVGFEPWINLCEGLAKLRDWYVGSGESPERLLNQETIHNWVAQQDRTPTPVEKDHTGGRGRTSARQRIASKTDASN